MNTKKMSKIRRKAEQFLVVWLKGLLNKDLIRPLYLS